MASLPGSLDGVSITLPTWLPWLGLIFTHLVAYWLGRWLKLRQLHRLQAQGLLSITTQAQQGEQGEGESIARIMQGDDDGEINHPSHYGVLPPKHQDTDDEHLGVVAYQRRDSEDRRDDWAIRLKQGEE